MPTLLEQLTNDITPEIESCYQKYLKGEICVCARDDYYGKTYIYFYALEKWWTVISDENVFCDDENRCHSWEFFRLEGRNICIDLFLRKIVKEDYMLIISDENRESNIYSKNENSFNVNTSDEDITFDYDYKFRNKNQFCYAENFDLKDIISILLDINEYEDEVHFHFEKHYYNHDESIKSNLIKSYYKNSLVNYNTKFGMNKMFDSFVF